VLNKLLVTRGDLPFGSWLATVPNEERAITAFPKGRLVMSVSAIASNLFNLATQLQKPQASRSNFADLSSQELANTQSSANAGSPTTNSTISFPTSSALSASLGPQSLFASELSALGAQLQAGNLQGSQQAYSTLQHDLTPVRDPEYHPHFHSHTPVAYPADGSSSGNTGSTSSSSQAGLQGILA
jgi:hypothetical protein